MASTKKLINHVETCVDESIEGFVAMNPGLCQVAGHPKVIIRSDIDKFKASGRVTTLTGGGSGHEPCFMGFIGEGLMSAAVHGSLFSAPAPHSILAALQVLGCDHPAGVLVVINNYTGDRLNFGIAVERAHLQGINVHVVINAEDSAVVSRDKSAGRRGLAACVLLMKIVGHLAEAGEKVEYIVSVANKVAQHVATMGVCLSPCSLPGQGPLFQLGSNDIELGMGMHGEAGVKRVPISNAHDVVEQIICHLTDPNNQFHLPLRKGDRVVLLVNNLGATSDLEMNIVVREAILLLENRFNVCVDRCYASKFVSSMEMAGISITLLNLVEREWTIYLDGATRATAWVKPLLREGQSDRKASAVLPFDGWRKSEQVSISSSSSSSFIESVHGSAENAERLTSAVRNACSSLISNCRLLNDLDAEVGDSDCGSTLSQGAKAVIDKLDSGTICTLPPHKLLQALAETVEQSMGGSSGALYSLFLTSASSHLSKESNLTTSDWVEALKKGIDTITRYGGAEVGDRTMLDALFAAWKSMSEDTRIDENPVGAWKTAVETARRAAEETSTMKARAGRASYVSTDRVTKPDAGATACVIWMTAILETYLA